MWKYVTSASYKRAYQVSCLQHSTQILFRRTSDTLGTLYDIMFEEGMIMDRNSIIRIIDESINEINEKICNNPLAVFNESDIQCYLYSILLGRFNNFEQVTNIHIWGTHDAPKTVPIRTMKVHSELLLPEGRVDLAILNIENTKFAFNSKGKFGYVQLEGGNHVFIEIKTSRTSRSSIPSVPKWKKLIEDDIDKLKRYESNICYLLCYDFNNYLDDRSLKELYKKAGINVNLVYVKDKYRNKYFID